MPDRPLDDCIDELRDYIERDVAAGFLPPADIVQHAIDVVADDGDPERLRPAAEGILAAALAAHAAEQATWPAETDCDRLDRAFAALEATGIVARQDFSCCGTCGASEIGEEMLALDATGVRVRGYTFYHQQDTESAAAGDGLYLAYGAAAEGDDAAVAVGHEVVATLRAHGLAPEWDGDLGRRIRVPLDWKRRRVDGMPVPPARSPGRPAGARGPSLVARNAEAALRARAERVRSIAGGVMLGMMLLVILLRDRPALRAVQLALFAVAAAAGVVFWVGPWVVRRRGAAGR